jgi:hypothetical protein
MTKTISTPNSPANYSESDSGLHPIPLKESFRSDGFDFKVIAREGKFTLLKKSKKNYCGYEVAIIQVMKARIWPDGTFSEAREHMPSSEQWGKYGWTYVDSEGAWKKFRQLTE